MVPGLVTNVHGVSHGRGPMPSSFSSTPPMSSDAFSSNISTMPESWFESEMEATNTPPVGAPSASKVYPDTWFEVADKETQPQSTPEEPMRYSPEGDLNGKVSITSPSTTRRTHSSTALFNKPTRTLSGEGKVDEQFRPHLRTLEEIAGGGNPGNFPATSSMTLDCHRRTELGKDNASPESLESSSAVHSLGMQFDDDTLDFLARLRREHQG